jgi:hypothetical protein
MPSTPNNGSQPARAVLPPNAADAPTPSASPAPPPNPAGTPAAATASGRDARGRFTKNNRGGPGNPFARQVAALRRALIESITEEDIRAVAARLLEGAKAGDVAAARLLLSYAIGKPGDCVDPDTLDRQEWDVFRKGQTTANDLEAVLGRVPVPLACDIARAALPGLRDAAAAQLVEALTEPPEEPDEELSEPAEMALPAPLPTPEELRPPRQPRTRRGEPAHVLAPPAGPVAGGGARDAEAAPVAEPAAPPVPPWLAAPSQEDGRGAVPPAACPASGQQPGPCGEPVRVVPPGPDGAAAGREDGPTPGQTSALEAGLLRLLRGLGLPIANGAKRQVGGTDEDGERW